MQQNLLLFFIIIIGIIIVVSALAYWLNKNTQPKTAVPKPRPVETPRDPNTAPPEIEEPPLPSLKTEEESPAPAETPETDPEQPYPKIEAPTTAFEVIQRQGEGFEADVFISCAPSDESWVVSELLPTLEKTRLKMILDFRDHPPDIPKLKAQELAVRKSRKTLLILSQAFIAEQWRDFETILLQSDDPTNTRLRFLPLLKEKGNDLPPWLRMLIPIDFTHSEPDRQQIAWKQLLTALGAQVVVEEKKPEAPTLPTHWFLAHPYPMLPNFTGRASERRQLTRWLEGDRQHAVLMIRALGGFGKSALVWHWLTNEVNAKRWAKVVWWSFYETHASFGTFLAETLAYLLQQGGTLSTSTPIAEIPPRQQVEILLQALARPGILLILDGFERELRGFSGLSAAYQGDEPQAESSQYHPEDCTSPLAERFLRSVASLPNLQSKVLLTTRLRPRPLEEYGGMLLLGADEINLPALHPDEAVAFFRVQGIYGIREDIQTVCERYGYHPLSLRLLAGLVLSNTHQPNDIAAVKRMGMTGNLKQRQHHALEVSYNTLPPSDQKLLSLLACFRGPVGYNTIQILAQQSFADGSTLLPTGGHGLDDSLTTLITRGLLYHDSERNAYDLHPIVRQYAYERLPSDARTIIHASIRNFFEAVPKPEKVERLEDLDPLIELYHHMVQARQFDAAQGLFRDQIDAPTYYQFGAYQLQIELLRALFPEGENKLPSLRNENEQARTLNDLALVYSMSGQPHQATPLFKQAVKIWEKQGDKMNVAVGLGNLAGYGQLPSGALREAEASLRRRITLCREIKDVSQEATGYTDLGRVLTFTGRWVEAEEALTKAVRMDELDNHYQGQGNSWLCNATRALLMLRDVNITGDEASPLPRRALMDAQRALELFQEWAKTRYAIERDHVRAYWQIGAAHRVNRDLDAANHHLTEALTRCRAINMVDHEADILLDLARLRLDEENPEEALRLANEALPITERSTYVLQGADVHLLLAQSALDAGDDATALEHARAARKRAICDGPPDYTYKVAYEEAERMLEKLWE